jgi:hypothetical protein
MNHHLLVLLIHVHVEGHSEGSFKKIKITYDYLVHCISHKPLKRNRLLGQLVTLLQWQ